MKREEWAALVLVATAFFLRAWYFRSGGLLPDEALYLHLGRNLAENPLALRTETNEIFWKNPPLFPYLLAALFKLFGGASMALARLATATLGAATAGLVFLLGRRLYGAAPGLLAAALLCVNPLHGSTSTRILTDVPLTFFVTLALWLLISGRKKTFWAAALAAVAAKYPAAPLAVVPLVSRERIAARPRLYGGLYAAGVLAALALALAGPGPPGAHAPWLQYLLSAFRMPNPLEMAREAGFFLGWIVVAFFVVGLARAARERDVNPVTAWLILFGTARIFLPWLAFRTSRYSLPLYPALLILAGWGAWTLWDVAKMRLSGTARRAAATGLAILFALALGLSLERDLRLSGNMDRTFTGFEAAEGFFSRVPPGRVVLTASPRQIRFFAPGQRVVDLPGNLAREEARDLVDREGVDFVCVDGWSPHQPDWAPAFFVPANGFVPVLQTPRLRILAVRRPPG
ncbi:MAG: glycosyltransferase family 39 protein [Proteobacteria bacterium]|nr:glycosyltransferase family 39 protein [Pseudomonadota bacterium]